MKFNEKYYSYSSYSNFFRKIGRRFFTPKTPALFKVVRELPCKAKILDVGSGKGGLLQLIEESKPNIETFGLDIGTPPVFMSKGLFLRGSVLNLPFKDNSFDLVTCCHVIEHVADSYIAVAELKRVCKPEGTIYIETPSHRSVLMPIGANFWDDPTHIRPYTRTSLKMLFEIHDIICIKDGFKRSVAGILLGFPYMLIGLIVKDPFSKGIFSTYAFGLFVYILGKKKPVARM